MACLKCCCLCLETFDKNGLNAAKADKFAADYEFCIGHQLPHSDQQDLRVCRICLKQLDQFQKFKSMCLANECKLQVKAVDHCDSSNWGADADESCDEYVTSFKGKKEEVEDDFKAEVHDPDYKHDDGFEDMAIKEEWLCDNDVHCPEEMVIPEISHNQSLQLKEPAWLVCEYCGSSFNSSRNLRRHMIKHKATYQCDLCSKHFRCKDRIRSHIETRHLKLCRFTCQFCSKNFAVLQNLKSHLKSIHQPHQFSCTYCNKTFANSTNRNRHVQAIHTKPSNFVCNQCGADYTSKTSLEYHQLASHSEGLDIARKCVCALEFFSLKTFKSHLELDHRLPDGRFNCLCGKTYKARSKLTSHFENHHGIELMKRIKKWPCNRCGHTYATYRAMRAHYLQKCAIEISETVLEIH